MTSRINAIIKNELYLSCYEQIQKLEETRQFCRHNMSHFLDVARISYIMILEDGKHISKETIYAAALCHDIGRHEQYLNNTPHEIASALLCVPILEQSGFNSDEIALIHGAISAHRNSESQLSDDLSGYLYRGDKASRICFSCEIEPRCNWADTKKNLTLTY